MSLYPRTLRPNTLGVAAGATVLMALLAAGCSRPRYEGPQLQEPPINFLFDANATQGRNVYPDREQLRQVAWARGFRDEGHSSVFITTYRGGSTREDVLAARNFQEERYGGNMQYSPLERLTIDDRTAWGWLETQSSRDRVSSLEYKAVVSYDSVSYAVEFYSSEPLWMDEQKLRQVVAGFAIGRTRVHYRAIIVALFGAGLVAALIGIRVRAAGASSRASAEGETR